jgi:hypothetical protein
MGNVGEIQVSAGCLIAMFGPNGKCEIQVSAGCLIARFGPNGKCERNSGFSWLPDC